MRPPAGLVARALMPMAVASWMLIAAVGDGVALAQSPAVQNPASQTSMQAPAQAPSAPDPVVRVDFLDDQLSPSRWTLTLHPDGSGHFHSEMGAPQGEAREIDAPNVDRDVKVSPAFAARVFEQAASHNWFAMECESHLKVAFQGWKTLTYQGPQGSGSCRFNYSKDKDIENLGDSLGAVAETILEGARLEMLLEHDRLGLDKEMEFLVDAAGNGRAQQICAIRDILSRLAEDDGVLERVRKRARMLLAQGDT
jgi:hypothetical protein